MAVESADGSGGRSSRLVYYSLANSPGSVYEQQWVQSIRSLRRYNASVPVSLFLFNGASDDLRAEAARWDVTIRYLGDYRSYLERLYVRGAILALYPTFHKFLSLADGPVDAEQVLYLDCDTFFFGDVDQLFDLYPTCDWYAREEPTSRMSHYGYDPSHIDEEVLERIAKGEGARPVIPFNSGVCVLNNGIWNQIGGLRATYLDLAWRLLSGRVLSAAPGIEHDPQVPTAILQAASDVDRSRTLLYPSTNTWIIEQIVLWLALGHLPDMTQGLLSRDRVVQGGEFFDALFSRQCIVAHYYSTFEAEFFAAVPAILE